MSPPTTTPDWELAGITWQDGDDGIRIGSVQIAGVSHHVTAIQVHLVGGAQRATTAAGQDLLDRLCTVFGSDERLATVFIDGRDYVLFVEPGGW